ncbi:S8 family serine peptidase [Haloplanus aerogenes]|uniref:Subtilase family protein n=1 Tax=Haloplanus aerogenes TaxID=660522 RepID=A0A3M0D9L9_9EURY|nr:S8 family serine peptidase [Haloplanus aerogenes]AZH26419.1 subtilase protease [Haloplanus aerogenes]RMB18117.1 subtilase family protein [Haloplanus aerogenes]
MPSTPRRRVVCLTLLVVLAVVQPTLAGAESEPRAETAGVGDVGVTVGAAIERHPSSAGATAEALRAVRADAVHERGHTGAGVSVGVIGQGFDTSGALGPHVAGWRQVGDSPHSTTHDTAVAEVVSETAPDANLYLAGVGRTPTPAEYAAAVEWLTARGADIIVDSGSYFPSVAADERRITAAAERATERGAVFVTSAGNYANRHWAGEGTADGWVAFAEDDAANALADGDPLRGRVTVRLRWHAAVDYDLYLYRRLPSGADRVVAKSTADETGPGLTVESIDVAVPKGRYYVAVYADSGVGDASAAPGRVQVFAARHELEHTTARGSMVAPATSDRIVAVGAVTDGERRAFSSLSNAGAVDLTAPAGARTRADPHFVGTSAAAPYVAGTAALVEAAGGNPSPTRVETILERTADGGGDTVDALAAVEAAKADGMTTTDGATPADARADRPTTASADGDTGMVTDPDHADRESTDAATAATERSESTNAADRTAGNVTRTGAETDGRDGTDEADDGTTEVGDGTTGRTDQSPERNRDDGADRSRERDRAGADDTSGSDDRRRRNGATGSDDPRER